MLTRRTSPAPSFHRLPPRGRSDFDPPLDTANRNYRKPRSTAALSNPLYDAHSDCAEPPSLAADCYASAGCGSGAGEIRRAPVSGQSESAQSSGTRFGGGHWSSRNRSAPKARRCASTQNQNPYGEEEAVLIQSSDGVYLNEDGESWCYGTEAADNDEDEAVALLGSAGKAIPFAKRRTKAVGAGSNWKILAGITLLAAVIRLFRISQPTSVVYVYPAVIDLGFMGKLAAFDEVHFGGFASKYIRGKFFMDVHPPLGKLLIALAGKLAGFDGDFDFKEIGKDYLKTQVPYVPMRLIPAIAGILLVPVGYLTVRRSGFSTAASVLAATALLFGAHPMTSEAPNGLTTQSRHILLDSPMVLFIALATLMWTNFYRSRSRRVCGL
ncbi:MAG: Dolichyl-phosphate-mannose-protein mannosyltransferase-domain-containing protein [Olpidium bornovanus]|uniref:Dolichyl-phosphate-mannose-protein mannosyltransferase-domain-containing protein n=1 Tax=Olpidium bornovanus TaxID=278681 RepID=A0A8H7ZPH5_9FUNG|nr:MAG: Dolichyl-phosphate-mannose-protein mannosyltransferase-domain-containing protein [Olpidium bornovanus]